MPVPDFQSLMLPLLTLAGDGQEHSLRSAIDKLADEFGLSDEERKQLLPSGRQRTFDNRVGWARTYMAKAGLLRAPRRAHFQITERGASVLNQKPPAINIAFLRQYPEFVKFQGGGAEQPAVAPKPGPGSEQTPEEEIEAAYQRISEELAEQLLEVVKKCSPGFFERLVIDLLVRMGYGGTRRDAGQAGGGTGDGGIDGIINADRLGLDVVYVQAKRWEGTVGRPQIQSFVGALHGQHARKGVFITTSDFSQAARSYASTIDSKIVLIDGTTLAQHMVDYNIGVSTVATYELKRVDSDYFEEE